jgi:hypothetical protein
LHGNYGVVVDVEVVSARGAGSSDVDASGGDVVAPRTDTDVEVEALGAEDDVLS